MINTEDTACPNEKHPHRKNQGLYGPHKEKSPLFEIEEFIQSTNLNKQKREGSVLQGPGSEKVPSNFVRQSQMGILKFAGINNQNDFPRWGVGYVTIGNFKKNFTTCGIKLSPVVKSGQFLEKQQNQRSLSRLKEKNKEGAVSYGMTSLPKIKKELGEVQGKGFENKEFRKDRLRINRV